MTQSNPLGKIAKMALGAVVVLLMGSALLPMAGATAPTSANSHGPSWAYGGSKVLNANGTFTTDSGLEVQFLLHAYYGWVVIYNQTNTSASTYQVQGERTVGVDVFLQYCTPTCASANQSVNITTVAWEKDSAFANFTNNGTVYVNGTLFTLGTPTTAVALMNANVNTAANVTMVRTSTHSAYDAYASAADQASGTINFQPALGLYPVAPPARGEVWNASSTYTGNLAWSGSYHLYSPMMGTTSGNLSGSLQSAGTVALYGGYDGDVTLHNGEVVHAFGIHMLGPIRFADGWFPLPVHADLFADHPWEAMGPMGADMATGDVDVGMGAGHLGMVAANADYDSSADVPMGGGGMGGSGGMSMSSPASTGPQSTSVQAQPMSVAQAEGLSNSLLQPGPASLSTSHPGLLLLVIGSVVIVAVAAVYVGTRRMKPRNPAGTYYAPYQQAGLPAQARPQPKTPEPGDGKDPLDHLM